MRRIGALLTIPRLFLLVLVALGVAEMHSTGHAAAGHGAPATVAHHSSAMPMPETAGEAAAPSASVDPGGDMGMDPTQVCLAVLTASSLLGLLAAAWHAGSRSPITLRQVATALRCRAERAPPRPPAVGLVLAELSVMRI